MTKYATDGISIRPPARIEVGYLAGIMDGEGYFACSGKSRSFGLRVAMIDQEVIDWLREHFGGNVSRAGETVTGNRVHVWYLQRQRDLRYVLKLLAPHLVAKRRQAEAMLNLLDHLDKQPRWDTYPTRDLSNVGRGGEERARRRRVRADWEARREELRGLIADER